ncbi:MAG: hypothetical protein EBU46_01845 [Nitrosomonadaceae bacterium]|nr:hypothetical protein [Nitrosomonadaceae bacterium]
MPNGVLDFLNQNSMRSFPLREGALRLSNDKLFTIPNTFLVDFKLCAVASNTATFHISKLSNFSDVISFEISDHNNVAVGNFNIEVASHTTNKDYWMVAVETNYSGAIGRATIGSLVDMKAAAAGTFLFNSSQTTLEMSVVVPGVQQISRLTLKDTLNNSFTLTGNVTLKANSNVRFRLDDTTIIIDAGENLGLNKQCADLGEPIRTINGVSPTSLGEFTLVSADCASFEPIDNGLILKDTCSKPCQGCTELSALTERSIVVESEMLRVRDVVDNLQNSLNQLATLINYSCECPPNA